MKSIIIAGVVAALVSAGAATATTTLVITSAQIKNGTIKLVDMSPGARRSLRGQRGFVGAPGTTGATGATGAPGANGGFDPSKVSLTSGGSYSVAPGDNVTADVYCPTGQLAISAGVGSYSGSVTSMITWPHLGQATIRVANDLYAFTITFTPYIVCAAR
jgi:hypothetical protein